MKLCPQLWAYLCLGHVIPVRCFCTRLVPCKTDSTDGRQLSRKLDLKHTFLDLLGPEKFTKRRELRLQRHRITPQKTSVFVITAGVTPHIVVFNESWLIRVWWYNLKYFLRRFRILYVKINCCTNRKVAGSIPGDVTGNLHSHNLSGRTVALELTQPLTEMCTRNISWESKFNRCLGLTN